VSIIKHIALHYKQEAKKNGRKNLLELEDKSLLLEILPNIVAEAI
jgi:hypothetical protein